MPKCRYVGAILACMRLLVQLLCFKMPGAHSPWLPCKRVTDAGICVKGLLPAKPRRSVPRADSFAYQIGMVRHKPVRTYRFVGVTIIVFGSFSHGIMGNGCSSLSTVMLATVSYLHSPLYRVYPYLILSDGRRLHVPCDYRAEADEHGASSGGHLGMNACSDT